MEAQTKENHSNVFEEINLKELFFIVWDKKLLLLSITGFFAIFSIFYALSLKNIYLSSAVMVPVKEEESLTSMLPSYSALAGVAGIRLPTDAPSQTIEAISRIQSLEFFSNEFLPFVKLENIMAVDSWNPTNNKISYKGRLFDENSGKWVRKAKFPRTAMPSNQEAYRSFLKSLSIFQDKETQFVSISIKHHSPMIAKEWLELLVLKINESMREEKRISALNSIDFLNEISKETNLSEMNEAISDLLEVQMKTLMLSSSNEDFVFKYVDPPFLPEERYSPNRSLVCIIITFLGFIFSILVALISHYFNQIKKEEKNQTI